MVQNPLIVACGDNEHRTAGEGAADSPVETGAAAEQPADPPDPPQRPFPALLPALLLAVAGAGSAMLLQRPVLTSEPLFALMNASVTGAMVALGSYVVIYQRVRFTGLCFIVAGASWPLNALNIYPGWGAYVGFVGIGAAFFTPLAWGILRYGRARLEHRSEQLFIPVCALLTSGSGAVFSLFTKPEWIGLPAHASWPTLVASKLACTIAAVLLCLGLQVVAWHFLFLVRRVLREAPPTRRETIRPLYIFSVACGLGSSLASTITIFAPHVLPVHAVTVIIGAFALVLTSGLGISLIRQDLFSARFVDRLPLSRTPESVTRYLKNILKDESVELFYLDPDSTTLIDADGRRRVASQELGAHRFHTWITDSDGSCIGLLTAHPLLRSDTTTLGSLARIVPVLVENARLQAVLRMRMEQLNATRVAQQLTIEHCRDEVKRDLHDSVQQTIAAARLNLDELEGAETEQDRRRVITQLDTKLRLALEEIHNLQGGGCPPDLGCGIKAAIDRVARDLRLTARCQVIDADLGVLTLPVYYLIRESLTNVHKHAQAGTVEVDLSSDGRTIELSVRDDGIGGAAEGERGGIGGMRRRVEELGGRFRVISTVGRGTTVTASLPCASS